MSNLLNEYRQFNQKIFDEYVKERSKKFLKCKSLSCFQTLLGVTSKNKNKLEIFKKNFKNQFINGARTSKSKLFNYPNMKDKTYYNNFFSKNNYGKNLEVLNKVKLKTKELIRNKNKKNSKAKIIDSNNKKEKKEKNIYKTFDILHKSNINNIRRRIQSAKYIDNNNNIDQKLKRARIKNIVKELLSIDKSSKENFEESHSRNLFPLSKALNPKKYIEYNLRNHHDNPNLFKSYKKQMKSMFVGNIRNYLIEGVNDYHQNLKQYQEVFPASVVQKNDNKKILFQKKLRKTLLNIKPIEFKNKSAKLKYKDIIYNNEKEKFRSNYIKVYKAKNLDKELSRNEYINKNKYFEFMNSDEFKKLMSLDDKVNMAYSDSRQLIKFMKKDSIKSFQKKYML